MSNIKMRDEQLIFLISLPRSGSTMLQKILGGHSEIYTRSEPWIMLHPLFALKAEGINTRYNASLAADGVKNFISGLPENSLGLYYESIRNCYLTLYEPYLQSSKKRLFLDKTPRYYEVFDELQRTFPMAKFIILYRNPLAVLSSILNTWVKGDFEKLKDYKGDFYEGVEFLQRDFSCYKNTHVIRYEDLLLNPELQVEAIFDFLQIAPQLDCVDYGKNSSERWMYGDHATVYEKHRPDTQHLDSWKSQLESPENIKLLLEYLQLLGKTCFEKLGYSYDEAEKSLIETGQYSGNNINLTLSFKELLQENVEGNPNSPIQNQILRDEINILRDNIKIKENKLIKITEECKKYKQKVKQLDGLLITLFKATDDLTAHRFIFRPKVKLLAYKSLLHKINYIRNNSNIGNL